MLPMVNIPPPPFRSRYARHVLEHGHRPNVLSGAELRGKARRYEGSYWRMRRRVMDYAAQHGVKAALVLHPVSRRLARVWVDAETGERVQIIIAE